MSRNSSPFYKAVSDNAAAIDSGLRAFMLKVFNYMGFGLAITGAVAFLISTSPELLSVMLSMHILLFLAQIGICFYVSFRINRITASTAQSLFWTFAVLMGASLSSIFVIYTGESIASTFFITSSMFLSMSLYGYTTGKDLSKLGSILLMGVIGLIVASVVNLFMQNSVFSLIISGLGVLIFTGLTAYDVQKIKAFYFSGDDIEISSKKAIIGALNLYLDFINLFIYILRFIGMRKD